MERFPRAVAGPPAGRWHVNGYPEVIFTRGELARWGAGTQAVIRPVLAELGRTLRRKRPQLGDGRAG